MPAIDVSKLAENEGENYEADLNLLFAASGDLRNVVKTLANVPNQYDRNITILVNDRDLDVAFRNDLLLKIAASSPNADDVIDTMMHIWYSAFLTRDHIDYVKKYVIPGPTQTVS